MSKIFTTQFKTFVIDKIISANPLFYIYLGKHTPFTNDNIPPTPADSVAESYISSYDDMIVGKLVSNTNISYMTLRNDWASAVGYTAYRDTTDLTGQSYYVNVVSATGYDVFKCLSNNNTVSLYPPDLTATSPGDDIYETADGYQWKYMYSIPTATFDLFATQQYIPVSVNTSVSTAAVGGAVDFISIPYGGSNYDTFTTGTFQTVAVGGNTQIYTIESSASSNNSFYIGSALKITQGVGAGQLRVISGYSVSGSSRTVYVDQPFTTLPATTSTYEISPHVVVVGSGTSFSGRALVNAASSNSIYKVDIINRGSGYYYATATAVGNTGGTSNSAQLSVIISPEGGHGYDPIEELGGKYLCLTTTMNVGDATASTKVVANNNFRNIGIVVNPLLANVHLTYTGATGLFTVGETVTQNNTQATGVVVEDTGLKIAVTSVNGNFLSGNSSYRYITGSVGVTPITATVTQVNNNGSAPLTAPTDYVNLTTRATLGSMTGAFVLDEVVTMNGNVSTSNATVYYANSSQVWLTSVRGNVSNTATIQSISTGAYGVANSVLQPDIIRGSGKILYMENISPINKLAGQTETIKAIIEF